MYQLFDPMRLLTPAMLWLAVTLQWLPMNVSAQAAEDPTKIVFLVGAKSHGPGVHEYIKTARLLKILLDEAALNADLYTELHYNGWPQDPQTLDDADLIVTISDGQDGEIFSPVPFLYPDRMKIMQQQMDRGCGFALIHFSTFFPDSVGEQILEWGGGYFDWQDDQGERNWYSAIKTLDTLVTVPTPDHPIANGLPGSFDLHDEYYYQIRFRENDERLVPLLNVPALEGSQAQSGLVTWAVERVNSGRGFCTTTGHFYSNWQDENYRKLILNGLVWAAGVDVPDDGVSSTYYEDSMVTQKLFGKSLKGLILTGNNHPAHDWKATTPVIQQALVSDSRIHVDICEDIEALQYYDLGDYDFLVMNYCNWEDPEGLSEKGQKQFVEYLQQGGGLLLIHFANGAFHASLPEAAASDWPEYRNICRRVWDHDAGSGHDKYGEFTVTPTEVSHPIIADITAFTTTDELYYRQEGDAPIEPLLVAHSKDTGQDEPMAWVYTYGKGKIFQTVLGHDVISLSTPEIQTLLMRAGLWVSGKL